MNSIADFSGMNTNDRGEAIAKLSASMVEVQQRFIAAEAEFDLLRYKIAFIKDLHGRLCHEESFM